MRHGLHFAVGLVVSLVACQDQQVCAPGSTQACICPGGSGAQTCAADGSRWDACACSTASQAPQAQEAPPAAKVEEKAVAKGEIVAEPAAPSASAAVAAVDIGPKPYTVTLLSADIAPSKPDGRPWDVGNGAPDPVLTVTVKGAGNGTVRSSKMEDTTAPKWNQRGRATINRGDRLQVVLVDKDLAADDAIASWDIEFTGPGRQRLKAPGVNSLIVDISPAE